MSIFARASAILCLAMMPVAAVAASDQKAQPILFETRQLDLIDKGAEVTYRFEKTGTDERLVGKNYADDIRLSVAKVGDKGERANKRHKGSNSESGIRRTSAPTS